MAHKHSRRRIRPRFRNSSSTQSFSEINSYSSSPALNSADEVSWLSADGMISTFLLPWPISHQPRYSIRPPLQYTLGTVDVNSRQNRTITHLPNSHHLRSSGTAKVQAQLPKQGIESREKQKIMLFGGEVGERDDIGLCGKMSKAFLSMEWLDET